jgi:thiol-disulfide isomerase/thioredoxin
MPVLMRARRAVRTTAPLLLAAALAATAVATAPPAAGGAMAAEGTAAADSGKPVEAKLDRLEGGRLRLSELRGRPVLLKLWATWCLPCRDQAAVLHELRDELS